MSKKTHLAPTEEFEKEPTRRARQLRDEELVEFGKGSGLDELEEEQKQMAQRKRNNKLSSDEVKHH